MKIDLEQDEWDRLKEQADELGITVDELAVRLVRNCLISQGVITPTPEDAE